MKIAYNPTTAAALSSAPNNIDVVFDLKGLNIFAKGIKFLGTDDKVLLSATTTSNYRPLILGYLNSTDVNSLANSTTNLVYATTKLYAQPSTGYLWALKLYSGGKEVLTSHQSLSNYVTINTALTITGLKTFSSPVTATKFIGPLLGNADTATKLLTIRNIWGQSFDGTNNINGRFELNGFTGGTLSIYDNTTYRVILTYLSVPLSINPEGNNVGIGTTSPAQKLHVSGNVLANGFMKSGSSDSYVLLGGGGHKALSTITSENDSKYVRYGKVAASTVARTNNPPYIYNVENEDIGIGDGNYYSVLNIGTYSGGDYRSQIAFPYQNSIPDSDAYIRTANGNTWRPWRKLWHNGNDGSGSGLDADKVDNYHAGNSSGLVAVSNGVVCTSLNADLLDGIHLNSGQNPFGKIPFVGTDGVMEVGRYLDFHYDNNDTSDYNTRLQTNTSGINVAIILPSASGTLARTVDNVASATKLQTARLINGTNFDGTSDITTSYWGATRTISLTGAVTGSVSTNGSGNITINTTYGTGNITNLDNRYVKKAGDMMTGTLTTYTNGTGNYNLGIRINRTASSNWATLTIGYVGSGTSGTSDNTWLIATPGNSNSLIFNRNASSESVGLCLKGHGNSDIRWNNNPIWHAGNDGSGSGLDADLLDGQHASSFASSTHTHSYLPYLDTRSTNYTPYASNFSQKGLSATHLKQNSTDGLSDGGTFHTSLYIYPWGDSSGGAAHNLAFTDNGNMWLRSGTSSWSSWKLVAFTSSTVTNADKLDGVHLNGIFTAFLANGNAARLVIGGVTKDLTIPYASLSSFLCKNSTFNSTGLAGLQYYDGDMSNTTNNNSWSVPSSGWHLILHLPLSVGGYFTELSFPVNDVNGLAWRLRRSSSYYGWYRILDSNNYSSYVKKIGTSTVGSSSIPIYLNAGTPTLCSTTLGVSITGNAASATKLLTSRTLWGQPFDGTANVTGNMSSVGSINMSGDILISQASTTGTRLIRFTCGDNDYGRIAAGGTASNAGWLEIATADDANEPIYVRLYSGTFSTLSRTATLLDGGGNTTFPGTTSSANFNTSGRYISSYASGTWINSVSNSALICNYGGYGGILCAPVKGGRIALSTYPSNDNIVYLGYASSSLISSGTNSFNRSARWNADNGYFYADGIVKNGSSDSYVLLGGGGHTLLSSLNASHNHDDRYVNVTGDTMTGALNLANGTWNKAGDDSAFGDANVAGNFCIKALNTTNPGITFFNNSGTNLGSLISNGNILQWNGSTIWHAGNDGSGSGLDADLLDGKHASSFSLTTHTHSYITVSDTRDVNGTPASYGGRIIEGEFKGLSSISSPSGLSGSWAGLFTFSPWNDSSGGHIYLMAFGYNPSSIPMLYLRSAFKDDTAWGSWLKLWHSGNDGNGSGLDADLLDGLHASAFSYKSWWHWSGQGGLPSWLWGGNTENNYYVYNPSNFSVSNAQYLRSRGNLNPQTGRTLSLGDVYSYNTVSGNTGAPTTYTSVIGFGRGTYGTVEIAGGWTSSMGLWYRSLRDTIDSWYSWRPIIDSVNYTNYVKKIGTSSVGSTNVPIYLNGGTPTACPWQFTGSNHQPIILYSGRIYRSGSTWYSDGITVSGAGTLSISRSGALLKLTLSSGIITSAVVHLDSTTSVSDGTSTSNIGGRSEGAFWFGVQVSKSHLVNIRPYYQGNADNDSWISYDSAWTNFIYSITVTLIGYVG